MKRPLIPFAVSIITGILIGCRFETYFSSKSPIPFVMAVTAIISLVCIGIYAAIIMKRYRMTIAGSIIFFVAGIICMYVIRGSIYERLSAYDGKEVFISGTISSAPEIGIHTENSDSKLKYSYVMNVTEISEITGSADALETFGNAPISEPLAFKGNKTGGRILLNIYADKEPDPEYGSMIILRAVISLPPGIRNPGGFDYRRYLAGKGISAIITINPYNILSSRKGTGSIIKMAGLSVRDAIIRTIGNSLPYKQAGLLCAMLIGYRGGVPEDVNKDFSIAGLSHLMAVSGANVAFIAAPLLFVLKKARIRRRIANILVSVFLLFFLFITGFEASVTRAVIMAVTILAGQMFHKEADTVTNLCFACIILLLSNPFALFDIGFQLSFTATLSLVLFSPYLMRSMNCRFIPGFIRNALASTAAAQLGVIPFLAFYFHRISVISLLSNILILPMVECITIAGAITAAVGMAWQSLSGLLGYPVCTLLTAMLEITRLSAALPFASITVPCPPAVLVMNYYVLLVFFFHIKPKLRLRLTFPVISVITAVSVSILLISYCPPQKKGLEITVLDVGQGDGIFISTPEGSNILIDTGSGGEGKFDAGSGIIAPFLYYKGISELDCIFITHPHLDHTGGLASVLDCFYVKNLILPAPVSGSAPAYEPASVPAAAHASGSVPVICRTKDKLLDTGLTQLISAAERNGTQIVYCCEGCRVFTLKTANKEDPHLKHTILEVLNPNADTEAVSAWQKIDYNEMSVVLKLTYGMFCMIFMGDAGEPTEKRLLSTVRLDADVLKAGHHGSATSSTESFLDSVSPAAAIISVGTNKFGHPSGKVLDRMISDEIKVYRTDECGAITVHTDGETFEINGMIQQ